ncbi:CcdC family protein [Brevibacillus laterosporus]|uniref:CcdC family protein n=1 Tax=Brevibacillus laterosporus TaxID=1465 RepID=UPI000CE5665F|nr:cytochrome c biogenesis protein CcdC [Brevibacillus laterosporus]MED1663505.1 cytochrome c biogenesis protein CcdC [Brevibacillus laterosporus]MED1670993.1 cytochrome c biogenesis protein CcdC [Brevibacillus laterosporus]MED1718274.1 cytochrome c biogenesis protein CcdC [Brevibacillus laterosporus]PPA88796.1 hypothetical protein C4A76_05845 [Brevibacillus laterosporus]
MNTFLGISPTVVSILIGLFMATTVIIVRLRSAKKPVSTRKIIIPPLAMATGFAMFHYPGVTTPISYDFIAFFIGCLFSIPLILSSRFEQVGNHIFLRRSNAFIVVLFVLLLIRLVIKLWVGDTFTPMQTAGLFFILAYGMILPWRVAMLYMYKRLVK